MPPPEVEYELPVCRECGSPNIHFRGGTRRILPELIYRYGRCRVCHFTFKAVFAVPVKNTVRQADSDLPSDRSGRSIT